ncbi:hypothetical protein F4805DRAFT_50127 [Annulohypoxylon moriforme]|nr:hypothetical protein F4805DRAFT_50127 [Annulohypoxylon moriforme]
MAVAKKGSNYGTPTHPVVMSSPSSSPGPPTRGTVEHSSDIDDTESVEGGEPAATTTAISHKSVSPKELVQVQGAETNLIQESSEVAEASVNRRSAHVAPLKLAQKAGSAASSEQTSPQNVIFNLPEDLNDNTKDTSNVRASSKSSICTRDLPGSTADTMEGDEVASFFGVPNQETLPTSNDTSTSREMKGDEVIDAGESDDVESLPDPQLAVNSKPSNNKEHAPGSKYKSKLPLAIRLHKDPPYPPPTFPLPATPEEPKEPRTRERAQSASEKAYALSPFPRERQITKIPTGKATYQRTQGLKTGLPTPEKSLQEEAPAEKVKVETSQVSFPTFGNSSLGSSSQYSSCLEYKDSSKQIQSPGAGPKIPVVVVSNIPATASQADLVQQPEMPTDTGSPIFYGRSRGRNAPPRKENVAQGRLEALEHVDTSATSSHGTSGDAFKPSREVVDATAELQKLASHPSPPSSEYGQAHQAGQQIPRSHHPMGNLAEHYVGSFEDTVIRHPQVPAPSRGTDRIHPASVVAASTPSRLLTHDFIRSLIHTEVSEFQNDLRTGNVTRPGALAMLSRDLEASSVLNQAGMRTFIRHQAAMYAPNISAS